MSGSHEISVSEEALQAAERLQDVGKALPSSSALTRTSGEGTGPAYYYHQAMSQLGQSFAAQSQELVNVVDGMQQWMREAITDLNHTNEDASAVLAALSSELEGSAAVQHARAAGSATPSQTASSAPVGTNNRTTTGWSAV